MKACITIFITIFGIILSLSAYTLISEIYHTNTSKRITYEIRVQKITGQWIDKSYSLPYDAAFKILSNKGSYYLAYYQTDTYFLSGSHWCIFLMHHNLCRYKDFLVIRYPITAKM